MGTAHLNVNIRDHACTPIQTGWMLDLVVQLCNGAPLFDFFPIIDQLKKRYAKPATVFDLTNFPLSDQNGNTLILKVGSGSPQTLSFTGVVTEREEVFLQMKNYFSGCKVDLVDDRIVITTEDMGPDATLEIDPGSTCDMVWAPVEQGSGYSISTRYYHGAHRINIRPPVGENINHIEMDVPVGCYKVWSRVCFGGNEETSTVMKIIEHCGQCYTVDLLLPEVMNCSQGVIYPLMDKVVANAQMIPEDRVVAMKAIAYAGNLSREQILVELNDRKQDAIDIERTDLEAQVDQLIAVAQALPQCV